MQQDNVRDLDNLDTGALLLSISRIRLDAGHTFDLS